MNRRAAILTGIVSATAGLGVFSLIKWNELKHSPSLAELDTYKDLIAELAEVIIPSTDTPGAKEAGVHLFILHAISNCTSPINQRNFLEGLDQLISFTFEEYNKPFVNCSNADKIKVLSYFEDKGQIKNSTLRKIKLKVLGLDFFSILKKYTIWGYCTSEIGATRGLAYDYIPSAFEPVVNIQNNQKAWATK